VSAAAGTRRRTGGLLLFSVLALAAFVTLIGLGTWQLERKAWKEALIDTIEQRVTASAAALPSRERWTSLDPAADEFRRVSLRGEFLPGREGRVYTAGSGLREDIKGPGYFAFAPVRLPDGNVVVINRGYVANPQPSASLSPIGLAAGAIDLVGALRWPEAPGWFVTGHDVRADLWFVRDHLAMVAFYEWGPVAPFYVDLEAPVPAGGVPRPSPLKVNLRNEHLQYALTWFGLAGVLAVVFAIWVRGRRHEDFNSSATRSR
jgi:cytochrome oxidase assembly protein ShyY1